LPAAEFFAASNGLLHLPTTTLHPPTPEFFGLSASEVVFDPAAPPPSSWLTFLDQILGDAETIQLVQEWFGYTLTPDTKQQKIFLGIGPRRSGKGTLARIHAALLGRNSVAGPPMSMLGETFGLQPLITKPLRSSPTRGLEPARGRA
jgi:putative DNA primase/helicase